MSADYGRDYSSGLSGQGAENVTNPDAYAAGQGARLAGDASQARIDGKPRSGPLPAPIPTGSSVGAGAGGAIVFFPFYGPIAAIWLNPLCMWGILATEFVGTRLEQLSGAGPDASRPGWVTIAMIVVGFLGFRLDDRLGATQPYYFLRHCYRLGLALVLFNAAGVREATGTAWPGFREFVSFPFREPVVLIIYVVFALVGHRLLRSDTLRRTWDYLLKFWRLRPRDFEVRYRRGEASFVPFSLPWKRI